MRWTLTDIISSKSSQLQELCRKHHVSRLELFGSATTPDFDPASSDLDFLVEFLPLKEGQLFASYCDLFRDLRKLFNRKIDLLTRGSIKNPFLSESIDQQRQTVYAA